MTSMDQQHLQDEENRRMNEIDPIASQETGKFSSVRMIFGLGVAVILLGIIHHIYGLWIPGSDPPSSQLVGLRVVTPTSPKSILSNRVRRRQLLGDEYYQEDDYYEADDEAPSEDINEEPIQQKETNNDGDDEVILSMTLMVENEEDGEKESSEAELLDEEDSVQDSFFDEVDKEEAEISEDEVLPKEKKKKKHDKSEEKEISESEDDPMDVFKESLFGAEEELDDGLRGENNVSTEGQDGEHYIDTVEEALLNGLGDDTTAYENESYEDPEKMVQEEEEHNIVVVKEALLNGFGEGTEATNEDEVFEVQGEETEGEEDNSTVHDSYDNDTANGVATEKKDLDDDQDNMETGSAGDPLDLIEIEEELTPEEEVDQENIIIPQEKNVEDIDMNGQDYEIDVDIEESEEGHTDDGTEPLIEPAIVQPDESTYTPTSSPTTSSPTLEDEEVEPIPITSDPTVAPTSFPTHSATHGDSTPTPTVMPVPVPVRTITTPLPTQKPSPAHTSLSDDRYEDDLDATKLEGETKFITEKKAAKIGGWMIALTLALMVMTAYQMSENPDGVFANVCRLVITVCGCVLKIVFFPCKKFFPNRYGGYSNHLVTTSDSFPHDTRGFL